MDINVLGGVLGGFVLGYLFARMDFFYVVLRKSYDYGGEGRTLVTESRGQSPPSFFKKEKQTAKVAGTKEKLGKIDIDTRTVVTAINTAGIQKGSDVEMGTTTATQDTINESVSRLAQLKVNK